MKWLKKSGKIHDGEEIGKYIADVRKRKEDFTNLVPWRQVERFPLHGNRGLYGFTYRHEGKIHIREDLDQAPHKKTETDLHESIHTPNERETRYLTAWMLEHLFPDVETYQKGKPPKYVH